MTPLPPAPSTPRRRPWSLRTQIAVVFGSLVSVVAILLSLAFGELLKLRIQQEAAASLHMVAHNAAKVLAEELFERSRLVEILASSQDLWEQGLDAPEVLPLLQRMHTSRPYSRWIGVVDAHGRVRTDSNHMLRGQDVRTAPWFQAGIKDLHVGDVHPLPDLASRIAPSPTGEAQRFLDFSAPIQRNGETVGVLAMLLSWDWARDTLEGLRPTYADHAQIELFLFDRRGELIYAPDGRIAPFAALGQKLPQTTPPPTIARDSLTVPGQAGLAYWNDAKPKFLTAVTRLPARNLASDLGWYMVVRQPTATAFVGADNAVVKALAGGLLAALLAALMASLAARRLSEDLNSLSRAAMHIEAGTPGAVVPQTHSTREVQRLSSTLDHMTRRLLTVNEEMEEVVRQRTLELQYANQELERLASSDPLTGLLNRRGFYQAAEGALLRNERSEKAQALMYMDLDGFKRINDSLGHDTGDRVLRWVGEQLKDCLGSEALLARMGGDEFTALFDSLPYPEQAGRYAEQLLERISISHQIEGLDVCLGVSIGIATYPDCGANVEGLLRAADAAMYAAKQAGRQQYRFYDQELNGRARSRLMLEDSVRAAIEQQDFTLVYQPQVSFIDGRLRGFEALLRWQHPSVGDVPPGLFIPLLEEARLINRLASWIYRQGAAQRQAWYDRFPADLVLGISLSRAQFVMPGLVEELQRVIQLYQLDPAQLEVEVAETSLMYNIDAAVKQIHRLRELGVRVALDDFGAGDCSLRMLRDLPIDTLKLDRHLVARLPDSAVDAALVRSVIGLCADYGITVIAEGVETPAQAAWLKANGCEYVQGFLVAYPMTAADASGFPAIFSWPGP